MAFILSDFVIPVFEYQLDKDSEVVKLDFYETGEKIQVKEATVRRKYIKKVDEELGQSLEDFIIAIQREVIFDVFNLPKETNLACATELYKQFIQQFKELAAIDEETVKN